MRRIREAMFWSIGPFIIGVLLSFVDVAIMVSRRAYDLVWWVACVCGVCCMLAGPACFVFFYRDSR